MKWRSLEESVASCDTRPLLEQFAERKELIAKYVPQEVQDIHARAVEQIRNSGVLEHTLHAGDPAPAFELKDQNGKPVSSLELLSRGALVICFIRGRWDPFCCGQMEAMNLLLPQVVEAGASLVAISPQTGSQSFFMADQHKLRFPLLSDPGNGVAKQFGLTYRVPDYQEAVYRRAFINLPFTNGDDSWELPIPATYVLGKDGKVVRAWADPDYTARPEPLDILRVLSAA